MKSFIYAILGLALFTSSCSTFYPEQKFSPIYQGVDARAQYLVDQWMELSKQRGLVFNTKITVGFKKISGSAIGICTYGSGWREIDLDIDFWNNSGSTQRLAVVFHELTHCYCTRKHDYDNGTLYPETETARIAQARAWVINGGERPGRFEDGCPTSIMYPIVLDKDCAWQHYAYYVDEMFNRCEPF